MTQVEALQTALAAEHAALYVYGVLGGRTSQRANPVLFADITDTFESHRLRRDRLAAEIRALRAEPVAAAPAYDVPAALQGAQRITRVALATERSCATTYAWLVANTVGDLRRWAIAALNEAAVRELAFRGTPEMFPGAGEHADR